MGFAYSRRKLKVPFLVFSVRLASAACFENGRKYDQLFCDSPPSRPPGSPFPLNPASLRTTRQPAAQGVLDFGFPGGAQSPPQRATLHQIFGES